MANSLGAPCEPVKEGNDGVALQVRGTGWYPAKAAPVLRALWPAYLLASILILYGFRWGLPTGPYQNLSFHADENAAVWAINQICFPHFNPHWFNWGTALLYQAYALKTLLSVGGIFELSDYWIYVIGRVLVYGYALGTLTLVYWLGCRLFDARTGRLAAILLAVLPGFVINSHYFKTDVPMVFWALAALLLVYLLIDSGEPVYVPLLGLAIGYGASTKYSAVVLVPAGLVALVMVNSQRRGRARLVPYIVGVSAGFLAGTPYAALKPGEVLAALRGVAALGKTGIPYYLNRPPAWIDYSIHVLPFALTLPMLILTAIATVYAAVAGGKRLLPIWTFLACYYVLLSRDNWRLVRYTVPLLPFAVLFVAFLISTASRHRLGRVAAALIACTVAGYAFLFSLSYVQVMAQTDPRVQASQWIEGHVSNDWPLPVIPTHRTNLPQLEPRGYRRLEVGHSIESLRSARSPFLILSDFGTRFYMEAIDQYPDQKRFFEYVGEHYVEVVRFENSQRLLGVDSKQGEHLPQDWLHPNPRITILKRRDGAGSDAARAYPEKRPPG